MKLHISPVPDDDLRQLLLDDVGDPPSTAASGSAWMLDETDIESAETVPGGPRSLRLPARRRLNRLALRREVLEEVLPSLPAVGESLHLVMDGCSDTYLFLPRVLDLLGRPADEVLVATWTMSRPFAVDFLSQLDRGRIRRAGVLVGEYFAHREQAVYATIVEGMLARGFPIRAHLNHCKLMIVSAPPDFLTIEGSGNWTGSRRAEQITLTNDERLADFHAGWMREVLNAR
jgi:hypothetical protein